jgi:hypothetical protein
MLMEMLTALTKRHWTALLISGFVLQVLQGAVAPFAPLVWLAAVPLLVLVRATPLWIGLPLTWVMMVVGRSMVGFREVSWLPLMTVAAMMMVPLLLHRLCHGRFARIGLVAFPAAVVLMELVGQQWQLLPQSVWPLLWATQSGNVGLMAHRDWLSMVGMTATVAWSQAVMAGYGELHLVRESMPQDRRESGLGQQTIALLFVVWIGIHGTGWLRHWFGD